MKLFRGQVTETKRSTSGWGDNEKTVGVDASVKVDYVDREGDHYVKTIIVHLPKELGQPLIGDDVLIGWEPTVAADFSDLGPIEPPVDALYPDDGDH